jgi:DNA-binding response OmpR family regulator
MGCRKVLLIEAEPEIRMALEEGLQQEGLECCSARSVEAAAHLLDEECVPAVVVLDYSFPLDDSAQLLARLREEPRLKDVPVVVTTTLPDAHRLGADLVLRKPYDLDEFLEDVKALARRGRAPDDDRPVILAADPCGPHRAS